MARVPAVDVRRVNASGVSSGQTHQQAGCVPDGSRHPPHTAKSVDISMDQCHGHLRSRAPGCQGGSHKRFVPLCPTLPMLMPMPLVPRSPSPRMRPPSAATSTRYQLPVQGWKSCNQPQHERGKHVDIRHMVIITGDGGSGTH